MLEYCILLKKFNDFFYIFIYFYMQNVLTSRIKACNLNRKNLYTNIKNRCNFEYIPQFIMQDNKLVFQKNY